MSAPNNVPDQSPNPQPADTDVLRPTPVRDVELARYDEYVDRVRRLCQESPGSQSALRAGLGKPVTEVPARMHAALLRPGLIRENTDRPGWPDKERAYYTVAALLAARPRNQRLAEAPDTSEPVTDRPLPETGALVTPTAKAAGEGADADRPGTGHARNGTRAERTDLGGSLALAVGRRSPDQLKSGAAESRLHLLVRQDLDGVHRMLPGVFRWLGSSGVAPDYACLLRDLTGWRYHRDGVTTRWLQAFYRSLSRQEAAAADSTPASRT